MPHSSWRRLLTLGLPSLALSAPAPAPAAVSSFDGLLPGVAHVLSIACHPAHDGRVLMATSAGLYATGNSGLSWVVAGFNPAVPPAGPFPYGLARAFVRFDATNPATIYYLSGSLSRSDDSGQTWYSMGVDPRLYSFHVHAGNGNVLLANTDGNPSLYTSINAGGSWFRPVLPPGWSSLYPWEFRAAFEKSGAKRSYIQLDDGLRYSEDLASVELLTGSPYGFLASHGTGPTLFKLVGSSGTFALHKSENFGDSWSVVPATQPMSWAGGGFTGFEIDPIDGQNMLASVSENGAFATADGGNTWANVIGIGNPLTNRANTVAFCPASTGSTAFIGTAKGIFRRVAGGTEWTNASLGLPGSEILAVAEVGGPSPRLLAGAKANGVYRSDDLGASWRLSGTGLPDDVDVPSICSTGHGSTVLAVAGTGVFASTDRGENWQSRTVPLTTVSGVQCRPGSAVAYAFGTGGLNTLAVSENGGDSWVAVAGMKAAVVHSVAPDPFQAGALYIATDQGVLRSEAANVAAIVRRPLVFQHAVASPVDPARVFAATTSALSRSDDGGATWTPLEGSGLPPGGQITALSHDPQLVDTLYAAVQDHGLYGTVDGGASWSRIDSLSSLADARALSVVDVPAPGGSSDFPKVASVSGTRLIVGKTQGIVSRLLVTRGVASDVDEDGIPNAIEALENRNPFLKDNDVFGSARLFAMQGYRDFLNREGDPAGIQGWADAVTAGSWTRLQVIDGFLSSQEFAGFVSPVVRLYFATFLRVPDYAGLTFNAGLVRNGTVTLRQLADFFTASPEFLSMYGSLDDAAFVTLLYNNVLGRSPDPVGLSGWVALLESGYTRGQVLLGFSDSAEYQAVMANEVFVTMMYAGMLRRTPEPAGFNGWVGFLDAGTYTREQVINGFFLSTEYRGRFLP